MKLLFYSPVSWPHLGAPFATFPHSNTAFDPSRGIALYRETLELFRTAEGVGFDWLGVGEEHMNAYGVMPNPCTFLAALAPITTRARLCVLGNPLPLLNPLRVAEEYAMIDMLSGGRLVAGFPRGVPQNYAAYGVDSGDSRERLIEAIDFVIKAWTHPGPFEWSGTHYRFRDVSIWPQPSALPEMVLSSKSPESVALAVRHRAVMAEIYVKNAQFLDHFIANVAGYREAAKMAGWQAGDDRFLVSVPCVVAPTTQTAIAHAETASRYVRDYISGSFEAGKQAVKESYYGATGHLLSVQRESVADRVAYGGLICGDPAAVIDQIQALQARTGAGIIGLQMQWGNLPSAVVGRSLELFGRHVRARLT